MRDGQGDVNFPPKRAKEDLLLNNCKSPAVSTALPVKKTHCADME
jgi:hypothetical protein